MALARLPVDTEEYNAIPLYTELGVVVAPRGHAIEALDSLTLADLTAETVLEGAWAATVELVAANVGVAVLPQSVARALSRRDVVARPVTDAPTTQVALVWPIGADTDLTEEFIGIVRGRTANSSRGRGR
jgi:DNA-binding transcriptional LysR family regulator